MAYGVFNLDSGNLIDSYRSEKRALELVAELLDDDNDPGSIGLVTFERGKPVRTRSGNELRDAAESYRSSVPA